MPPLGTTPPSGTTLPLGTMPPGTMPPSGTTLPLGTMPPLDSLEHVPSDENASAPPSGSGSAASTRPDPPVSSAAAAAAAAFCNLLPFGASAGPRSGAAVYIGEGLPPVPSKLADRIRRWEFVDMSELLPEFWDHSPPKSADSQSSSQQLPARRTRRVTDIATWTQCFASYVGVLSGISPEAVPELITYLVHMVRVSQDFGGMVWVNYDMAFRRQAATTGNRQWSRINPSLYSICFAGAARTSTRCDLCLSLTHETRDCALSGGGEREVGARISAIESAVLSLSASRPATIPSYSGPVQRREICRNWNQNRCSYVRCRFRHVCRVCQGPRPAIDCCERALGPTAGRGLGSRPRDSAKPY